jgi:TPR repeat protein
MLRRVGLILLALLALPLLGGEASAQARRALIIGNASYATLPHLQNTLDDAEAYRETFADLGYEISFYTNLDLDGFAQAVDSFAASIQTGDTAVVVYTGHGWSDGRENFLIPTDAPVSGSETKLRGASYPLRDGQNGLLDLIDAAGAGLSVAIIDACRNNPFTAKAGTRAVGYSRGLAPVSAPNGSFVIFSAGEGQEALDRLPDDRPDQKLSVFTRTLAPLLQSGAYLEDAIAEAQLETATMAATVDGHLQHPAYYDQTLGKTCLAAQCREVNQPVVAPPEAPVQPVAKAVDEGNPLIVACDAAAASGNNPDNPNGFAGVSLGALDAAAQSACAAAVAKFPDHPRSTFQLARVKAAQGDGAGSLALLQDLAGKDYPAAVFGLAEVYRAGLGVAKNLQLAARYYQTACKLGHPSACASFGQMQFRGQGVAPDQAQGLQAMQQTCDQGLGLGCEYAAWAVSQDSARAGEAMALLQKACDLGQDSGCSELGRQQAVAEDFTAAIASYGKACDQNHAPACRAMAVLFSDGKGAAGDGARAVPLLQKACDLNDGPACHALGWAQYRNADYARSTSYFTKACDLRDGEGCTMLGYQAELGNGTAADVAVARKFYDLGCSYDDGTGCQYAASQRSGSGASATDRAEAEGFAKKSCDLAYGPGCAVWADLLAKHPASAEGDQIIAAAYSRACDLQSGYGCAALGLAYHEARLRLAKDDAKARALLQRGCDMPNAAEACHVLASFVTEVPQGDASDGEIYVDAALRACDGGFGDRCVELALFDFGPARPRPAVDLLVQGLQMKSELPKRVLSSLDAKQTALLQQALGQLGLYTGAADGKRGKATIAALDAVYAP